MKTNEQLAQILMESVVKDPAKLCQLLIEMTQELVQLSQRYEVSCSFDAALIERLVEKGVLSRAEAIQLFKDIAKEHNIPTSEFDDPTALDEFAESLRQQGINVTVIRTKGN